MGNRGRLESRTRTNCSFVREKRNFVVRTARDPNRISESSLSKSRAAIFFQNSTSPRFVRPGPRVSGQVEDQQDPYFTLTKFFRGNRSCTHASATRACVHTHTSFQRRSRRDYLSGKFNYFASAERRYPISRRAAEITRKSAFRNRTITGNLIYLPGTNRNICFRSICRRLIIRISDSIYIYIRIYLVGRGIDR